MPIFSASPQPLPKSSSSYFRDQALGSTVHLPLYLLPCLGHGRSVNMRTLLCFFSWFIFGSSSSQSNCCRCPGSLPWPPLGWGRPHRPSAVTPVSLSLYSSHRIWPVVNTHPNAGWWVGWTYSHLSVFADSNFFSWFSAPFFVLCLAIYSHNFFQTVSLKTPFQLQPPLSLVTITLYSSCHYENLCHKLYYDRSKKAGS